jgi:hypothetical protein
VFDKIASGQKVHGSAILLCIILIMIAQTFVVATLFTIILVSE